MLKKILFILCGSSTLSVSLLNAEPQKMIISVPVATVYQTPIPTNGSDNTFYGTDIPISPITNNIVTQLLCNDPVVADPESKLFPDYVNIINPIRGYIKKNQVIPVDDFPAYNVIIKDPTAHHLIPIGSRFTGINNQADNKWLITLPDNSKIKIDDIHVTNIENLAQCTEAEKRAILIEAAIKLLETPFMDHGCSMILSKPSGTGLDTTGLIYLVFRVININVPAHKFDQITESQKNPLSGNHLQPGDVISFEKPDGIKNIALYLGNQTIMHASSNREKMCVVCNNINDLFEEPLDVLTNGSIPTWKNAKLHPAGTKIFFGSFLKK